MSVLEILNDRQKEAAAQLDGPVLILAGAGSGKTRVLTNRTAYMIDEAGVSPWNILAITFTNKAADEMRERIDRLVGFGSESIWVATFHSTCVRILRRHIDLLGFDNNFTIYDPDDSKSVMKDVLKRLQIDTKQYPEKRFLNWISSCKDELSTPADEEEYARGDYADELFAKVYREYQLSLQKNNALDFDDLIMKTVELFKAFPDVLENYQNRFLYIMVDEYQDTNTAQFELIRLLAAKNRNICVVGDDDQSIYKFRGANIRNILDFEKVYPDAKVIKLEQNYRSTQTILDAANSVIKNNGARKDKALWTDRGEGERIVFAQTDTAYEEAELIVDRICRERRAGKSSFGDNAVLYRTNAQSRLLEEKCVMAGIPYTVVGGVNFYSRKEIKDILAYLKTIDNGRDDLSVRRIINVPKRGIGATTIGKLADHGAANDLNFYECCKQADDILGHNRASEKIAEFVDLISVFRTQSEFISISELIETIIKRIDYEGMLIEADEDEAKERMENIGELINKAVAYEESADEPTLSEFLEEVALVADIDGVDSDADRVMLMTLHSAKGLEFPNVYIAGMEDGLFPSYMSICSDDPGEIEEERRLCYVGITRAMNRLTLTAARSRMTRGETQYNAVSRFINEIPSELFESGYAKKSAEKKPPNSTGAVATKVRPAAVLPKHQKPFIAKATAFTDLKKGADINLQTAPDYGPGDRVMHMKFGQGTVLSVEKGTRDYEVSVEFDSAGVKKMFAAFAKLKKI
ncbi:MAG: DNA helicase PcrA [Lachnospiraceae bacterium]|nr:DNA helicase PcrA [Lachnospiraceae bacterium]